MCKPGANAPVIREQVAEHLEDKLESNMEEIGENKFQWAISQLRLMSVEQKVCALEAMEKLMSPKDWRKFQEERHLGILEEMMDQICREGWSSTRSRFS